MRNKVLIVGATRQEREELEQILQSVVEEGGELFFAEKREDALSIIAKETPQLVFLDTRLIGESTEWLKEGVRVVMMYRGNKEGQKSAHFVMKPFKAHQVLEQCREVLGKEPVSPIPPM